MITELLLDAFETVTLWVIGLFPVGDPLPVQDALLGLAGNLGALNYFLPIAEVFALVLAVVVLFPVLMGVTFLVWAVALLRGGSARG